MSIEHQQDFHSFLSGLQFSLDESYEIIIVGEKNSENTKEMLETINSKFIPNKVVMLITEENKEEIKRISSIHRKLHNT